MERDRLRRGTGSALRRIAPVLLAMAVAGTGCWSPDDRREAAARSLYDRHCAECHGLSHTGPTPVADREHEPADLRRLSAKYGTPLDRERLAAYIDGRHGLPAERSADMPVWGEALYDHLPEGAALEELREGAIALIVEYLQSVQVEEPSPPGGGEAPDARP